MRVYHFVNRTFGLEDIRLRRLKIATLSDLNDPFEMLSMALRNPELRRALLKTKEEMAARAGLLCFSRNWRNPVQWSHYADHHRGLCLGFEVPDDAVSEVVYSRKRLAVDQAEIDGPNGLEIMGSVIRTKFSHWRYENEIRIYVSLRDRDPNCSLWFRDFDDKFALREVIVGADSDVSRQDLSDALGDLDGVVSKRKARLSFQRFAVVTQRKRELWT